MSRLEELLELKELIEAEIEELEVEEEIDDILDETLEEITGDVLDALEDEGVCPHCTIKNFLHIVYDLAYEDAVNDILEAVEE